ncbi:MAG: hypothetical protein WC301_05175 [Candidatus Omnitrophota bacterium]|jgi:hypothetical protein
MIKRRSKIAVFSIFMLALGVCRLFGQQEDGLDFTLDINSAVTPLPRIFRPSIDLSGRGAHRDASWPQGLAAQEVVDLWGKDIGFNGVYRMQYNLWEINQLAKDKDAQDKLLGNYENIMRKVTEAGGVIILDIFSTPAGLGQALDKKSPPWDFRAFKELIKNHMRNLSCVKRYNIWYEVWSAPDLDDFFLGRKQEYMNMYRAVAEAAEELSVENKIYIPVGGPSVSWWFQNLDSNTIVTAERSLIYELIKFCYHYHLPLDFISWHAYSSDPKAELENTLYKNNAIALMRDWLSYFGFDKNTSLIIDEWNYDSNANLLPERQERSYVAASYIPSRVKNMHKAGINYQTYYSLEDFRDNKEGVTRNTGAFSFDPEYSAYKGAPKAVYNAFRMLGLLGNSMFTSSLKPADEFAGVIATKSQDRIAVIFYNYIDTDVARNYLSRNIAGLNGAERKVLVNLVRSGKFEELMSRQADLTKMRLTKKLKTVLNKAQELNDLAAKHKSAPRAVNINIKNIKGDYLYQRYVIDKLCAAGCDFTPAEEKLLTVSDLHKEILTLEPYSVTMIIFTRQEKPVQQEAPAAVTAEGSASAPGQTDNSTVSVKDKTAQE